MSQNCVLLRVGIDAGAGGIQGPLFEDGTFEFVCIPDGWGVGTHTYSTLIGRNGKSHLDYFSIFRQRQMATQTIHLDPEFETFTYGDPTTPKRSLKNLKPGDLLVFYCGLQKWDLDSGWDRTCRPALYLAGFFEVSLAGMACEFDRRTLKTEFGNNFHVCHRPIFEQQKNDLILVKGGPDSRLFRKAYKISEEGRDRAGKPLKVLSRKMQNIFGDFGGHISIQRSPPRWVEPKYVENAIEYVRNLK